MTPDEARALLDGTTPGPWVPSRSGYIGSAAGVMIHDGHVLGDTDADTCLIAAAPTLAAMAAGMREEWGAERQVRGRWVRIVFALNTLWTDDRAIAESAVDDCRDLGLPARIVRRYVTEPEEA